MVSQTTIQGNFIGTDIIGSARISNSNAGISFRSANGSPSNLIGGVTAGARNIISGNQPSNIDIIYPNSNGNLVQGNFIGPDVNGTAAVSPSGRGVELAFNSHDNTIGGTTPAARNIISGNTYANAAGVFIREENSSANLVQGNYIGTDITGTLQLPNYSGCTLIFSAAGNTIGGDANAVPGVRKAVNSIAMGLSAEPERPGGYVILITDGDPEILTRLR